MILFQIPYLKVPDLKRELKIRGLTVSGKKEELIERLQVNLFLSLPCVHCDVRNTLELKRPLPLSYSPANS